MALPARLIIVGLRVLAWPLTGLVTETPIASLLAAALVIGLLAWRTAAATGPERTAARWFAMTLAWTVVALTVAASGLATVIPGLPNDHYHAFADPIVFVVVGLGVAALARWRPRRPPVSEPAMVPVFGTVAAVALVAALLVFNLTRQPPAMVADGGWPAARAAAARVLAAGEGPISLQSLPTFKSGDALRFPLERAGATVVTADAPGDTLTPTHVVLCDSLFNATLEGPCGGPAEDGLFSASGLHLVDRFEAAPGRFVSVYR
jgi:hypothetical protein